MAERLFSRAHARSASAEAAAAKEARAASKMTLFGILITFFPALVALLALACMVWLAASPGWLPVACAAAVLYLLPVAVYRLHGLKYPKLEGGSRLVGHAYSPWYGTHQIQLAYIAFPALEALLRMVPGLYSAWLRLWGARVGRGVYWTPHVEIVDRGLVEIGDHVVFGHRSGTISHVIRPSRGNLFLYVRRVRIGDAAFIGAGAYLGPGAVIEPGVMVPVMKHVFPNEKVSG